MKSCSILQAFFDGFSLKNKKGIYMHMQYIAQCGIGQVSKWVTAGNKNKQLIIKLWFS